MNGLHYAYTESYKYIFKNNRLFMKNVLIISFLLVLYSSSYAQSSFEIKFGEEKELGSMISESNKKGEPVKWINVNTLKSTWSVEGNILYDSGQPTGVIRSEKQYENFILHVEWKHMDPGGNSGVFVWSNGSTVEEGNPYPNGIEVQILDPEWINIHKINGKPQTKAFISGEMWGVNGVTTVPDNPRGERSKGLEYRVKGHGIWNTYDVVCVDGIIKLAINGKFVNGISQSSQKKGYLCLESEGGKIYFRNLKIIKLPPGVTSAEQTAPVLH